MSLDRQGMETEQQKVSRGDLICDLQDERGVWGDQPREATRNQKTTKSAMHPVNNNCFLPSFLLRSERFFFFFSFFLFFSDLLVFGYGLCRSLVFCFPFSLIGLPHVFFFFFFFLYEEKEIKTTKQQKIIRRTGHRKRSPCKKEENCVRLKIFNSKDPV